MGNEARCVVTDDATKNATGRLVIENLNDKLITWQNNPGEKTFWPPERSEFCNIGSLRIIFA